jgi:hypothetical protein
MAYLFCSYKAQADKSVASLLPALVKQLVQSQPEQTCGFCSPCFITEIMQKFQSSPKLEVHASEEDVSCYVAGPIPRLRNYIQSDEKLKYALQNKIVEAVDGILVRSLVILHIRSNINRTARFLLARLHGDLHLDKWTKQERLSMLEILSKGSAALGEKLDEAHGGAIKRIEEQPRGARTLARHALSWLSYAQRRLTTKELDCTLAIKPGDEAIDNDNLYNVEDITPVCTGLVTVDAESIIVRLAHYTTPEYFKRVRLEWNPSAAKEISIACLT